MWMTAVLFCVVLHPDIKPTPTAIAGLRIMGDCVLALSPTIIALADVALQKHTSLFRQQSFKGYVPCGGIPAVPDNRPASNR